MKDKIFNRLHRGDTNAHGMGLGMYRVKSLVDSYGGRVWAEGELDHGATFYFTLKQAG